MKYFTIITILAFFKFTNSFWPVPYRVELNDRKTFVITAGENGDEDEEIEMIRPNDLIEIVDLDKNEERYKPLHSHVEHYNRRAAEAAKKYSSYFTNPQINLNENHFVEEEIPFIAGFKHDLDKYNFKTAEKSKNYVSSKAKKASGIFGKLKNKKVRKNHRKKKDRKKRQKDEEEDDEEEHEEEEHGGDEEEEEEEDEEETDDTENSQEQTSVKNESSEDDSHAISDLPERLSVPSTKKMRDFENEHTTSDQNVASGRDENVKDVTEGKSTNIFDDSESAGQVPENEENTEETYDYESLRAEYELQMEEAKKNNLTYNITDTEEPEESPNDAIKKIVDFDLPKNCTEEELSKFGAQAFACLAHDYQKAKNHTEVRKIVSKTWRVMKIWICIYICIAVPAWCAKGWCCCCFRCSICFPHERISVAKAYYAHNEPGILVDQHGKKSSEPLRYKPTLFEIDAYEDLESAIRNL